MRVLVTGSSGLIGSAVVRSLINDEHRVVRLVRRPAVNRAEYDEAQWSPEDGKVDSESFGEIDAVVHLAGANVAEGRWNAERKATIRNSRVRGTSLLAGALAGLNFKPAVFVCASASGYYGDRGEEILTEASHPGTGFLAETAVEWENAAREARDAGIRTVHLRSGLVLSRDGGILPRLLLPFKTGLGAKMGNGKQWWPWIALVDAVRVIRLAIDNDQVMGPINVVAPGLVRNSEFTRVLADTLSRPAVLRVPRFAAGLVLGEFANEGMLASQRIAPVALERLAFNYLQPDLEDVLRHELLAPNGKSWR